MTTNEKVCELIMKVKKGKLTQDQLKPEAKLINDLDLDSLDVSELLVFTSWAFSMLMEILNASSVKTSNSETSRESRSRSLISLASGLS